MNKTRVDTHILHVQGHAFANISRETNDFGATIYFVAKTDDRGLIRAEKDVLVSVVDAGHPAGASRLHGGFDEACIP